MSDDDESSLPRRRQSIVKNVSEVLNKMRNFFSQEDGSILVTFTGPSAVDTLSTFASNILPRIEANNRDKIVIIVYDAQICSFPRLFSTAHDYGECSQLNCMRRGSGDHLLHSVLFARRMTPALEWTRNRYFHSEDELASQLTEKFDIELVMFCLSQGGDDTSFPQSLMNGATRRLTVQLDDDEDSEMEEELSSDPDDDSTLLDTPPLPTPNGTLSIPVADSPQPTPPITPAVTAAPTLPHCLMGKEKFLELIKKLGVTRHVSKEPAALVPPKKRRVALDWRGHQDLYRAYKGGYDNKIKAARRGDKTIGTNLLVEPNSFRRALDKWLQPKKRLYHRLYLRGLSRDSVRRIGYASVILFPFLRKELKMEEKTGATKVLDILRAMGDQEIADTTVALNHWHGSLPPTRLQAHKFLRCDPGRAAMKELSTVQGFDRSILAVFRLFGIVPASSRSHPCPRALLISNSVKASSRELRVGQCGPVRDEKLALGSYDLTTRMNESAGVETEADLQSWLVSLALVGTGLRPGSVKERPGDQIILDFGGLRSRHVTVYRVRRLPSDPPAAVRLLCEIDVVHQKTSGMTAYTPTSIGLPYPRLCSDGSWDWRPSAGLAIALAATGAGIVHPNSLYSHTTEPDDPTQKVLISKNSNPEAPLFMSHDCGKAGNLRRNEPLRDIHRAVKRALASLSLPEGLFSAKSFRCGFAQDICADVIMRRNDAATITKEDIRKSLHSSNAWASRQSDVYMRHAFLSIQRFTMTTSCSTAGDWLNTLHKNSVVARSKSFEYISKAEFANTMVDENPDNPRQIEQAWRLYVASRYLDAEVVEATTAEIRARYVSNNRVIDMRRTVDAYVGVMGLEKAKIPFSEALGHYYESHGPPYTCPGCGFVSHDADDSIGHWKACHGTSKLREDDSFECPCGNGRMSTWKSLRNHIRDHPNHKKDLRKPAPFKFHYV